MGINGLLTFCKTYKEDCVWNVDLVDVAQREGGIEILADFLQFEYYMISRIWESLERNTGNAMIRFLGGEYKIIDEAFTKIYKDLKSLGITLVVFLDGTKGICPMWTAQKLETWISRYGRKMKNLSEVNRMIQGQASMEDLECRIRSVLLETQVLISLEAAGCEIVQCLGEADDVLAKHLVQRHAFAILSSDSDFCIFEGSMFIPLEMFDLEDNLHFGDDALPQRPRQLKVGAIQSELVMRALQLKTHDELVELSIIRGNDFTSPFVRGPFPLVDSYVRDVEEAADWVSRYGRLENNPATSRHMRMNKEFAESVAWSRAFYKTDAVDVVDAPSAMTQFIYDQVRQNRYTPNIGSMHCLCYWHIIMIEDMGLDHVMCDMALAGLRSHIYRMVLKEEDSSATEYGWGFTGTSLTNKQVYRSHMEGLPPVMEIQSNNTLQNLGTFSRIMTHYEPDFQVNYFEEYGSKRGFTLYLLRYFLNLNVVYDLKVKKCEFMALVAAVLVDQPDIAWYQRLSVKPTLHAITIGNWLQNIYNHAYLYLGSMFGLMEEFPKPSEIFSGAVWITFYMSSVFPDDLHDAGILRDGFCRIRTDMRNVIDEHRPMVHSILNGFFNDSSTTSN